MGSKPWKAIKPMFQQKSSWKLRAGDLVQVMTGKDKGKQGEVLSVIRDKRFPRVIVGGVNMVTRHVRSQLTPSGEKIPGYAAKYEAALHYSNVMLVDPETKKPVRVAIAYEDKPPHRKVRVSRGRLASGCIIPWPQQPHKTLNDQPAVRDTRPEDADAITYNPEADFNLELPAAHRHLRELRELRDAAAAAAAAEQKQQQQQGRKLFSNSSSSSSRRGYHAAAVIELQGPNDMQRLLSNCSSGVADVSSRQQRLPMSSSSSTTRLLGFRGVSSRHTLNWFGLAPMPYLL